MDAKKTICWTAFGLITLLVAYGLWFGNVVSSEIEMGLVYDWLFFGLLLLFLYFMYDRFNQTPYTLGGTAFLMVFHTLGAVALYGLSWGWLQFDMIMHTTSGLVLFFFSRRILFSNLKTEKLPVYGFSAVVFTMGLVAIHEIIEFFSYWIAGSGPGLFTSGGDMVTDYIDLSWDILTGAIGATVSWLASIVWRS